MRAGDALSIADLRAAARRRLPRVLFEVIESGVEDARGVARNEEAFQAWRLMPRYLVDVTRCERAVELMGRRYGAPFGIGPTGFAGLLHPDAEGHLADAAAAAGVPFVLSGASIPSIERAAARAREATWCHLYPAKDEAITMDQVRRAREAGLETLVLTVDNPVFPKREQDTKAGFRLPFRPTPRLVLDVLTHPAWFAGFVRSGGLPAMETWRAYAPPGARPAQVAAFFRSQSPTVITWDLVRRIRDAWPGSLVLKGIQHPDDALAARGGGIDAVIVSNHGAKSYDPLPAPLDTLPAVRAAVGPAYPVLYDGGIRRGSDVLVALALGADFCFVGRATLYGVAAFGRAGADRALAILADEVERGLAMIGCPDLADLGPGFLVAPGAAPPATTPPFRPQEVIAR